ncbi:cyclase family protein [Rhizobium giardinii]|uniref:Kynurenine formamidase n=1 Tax=Rhizobium giardinii TaxID=56731 RepID=A0A7W8UE26_9HYPH|nr:cyclase family protein [Rhizobium giardinii]MBB5536400.1 kynurenine formamidase [Rhizobium giardinii]
MTSNIWKNERLPSYVELKARTDAPAESAWGLFGTDDQIGTVNLLTEEVAAEAATLVRKGASFGLDYELNAFKPPVSPYRKTLVHCEVCRLDGQVHDDYVNDFFPQAGSHIDGLRHHKHSVHGFYNNVDEFLVGSGTPDLGVQQIGRRGMVGRGVLVDIGRYRLSVGRPLDLMTGDSITLDDVQGAVNSQGLKFRTGDILLLHTGWAEHFLGLNIKDQQDLIAKRTFCGLAQSEEMLAWLWDSHFSVVASDTVAVEVMPTVPTSPFDRNVRGMMHPDLIALLGLCLGEMWKLDDLARDCAADKIYECMLVSKPLTLVGGVGSPCNAVAIK